MPLWPRRRTEPPAAAQFMLKGYLRMPASGMQTRVDAGQHRQGHATSETIFRPRILFRRGMSILLMIQIESYPRNFVPISSFEALP